MELFYFNKRCYNYEEGIYMYQNIEIEKLDHFGRGIAFINAKIVFVKNALPQENVDLKIIKENKKYREAIALKHNKISDKRIKSKCPFFGVCGGCDLLFYDYIETINFKLNKAYELIKKNKINYKKNILVVKNKNEFNYRNKVSLKIVKGHIGFYQENTHKLEEINNCKVANRNINKVIEKYCIYVVE